MKWMWALPLMICVESCSVQATLTLQRDGSAETDVSFETTPEARAAWSSLRELDATLPSDPVDTALLNKNLGERGRAWVEGAKTLVHLKATQLNRYLTGWETEGKVWEGTLDRATLSRWAALSSWADSPALDTLLPAPGSPVSQADYRDLLVYLLGSSTDEAAGRAIIDASTVQLTVVAPAPVKAAPGSFSIADRRVTYRWPLTRVLTLETPIRLRLEF